MKKEIIVPKQDVVVALYKAGGEANISQMYEAFNKENYVGVLASKLKTAIRETCLELAEEVLWFQAVHVNGKRTYVFKFT